MQRYIFAIFTSLISRRLQGAEDRVLMRSILTIMLETKNQLEKCYY